MKQLTLTLTLLLVSSFAFAQKTSDEGLSKLKANLSNAKANLEEYKKNLKIVDENLSEIAKAKKQVEEQRATIGKTVNENDTKLGAFSGSEKELATLISTEQKELQAEDARIQELSKVLAQLKDNQAKRQANIANYQEQMKQVNKEKGDWKGRGDTIGKTQAQLESRLKSLQQQESEWKAKQVGYKGEVGRWTKEVERQQKLNDNYNSLAEVKD